MSIPSGIIRFAGTWSVTTQYVYADLVVSPIDNSAYVLVVNSLFGGTDPSIPSANWVLIPSSGGGTSPVTSVLAGTNITSVIDVGGAWTVNAPDPVSINNGIPYTLSGATAGAVITNKGSGITNPMTQNIFNLMTTITFNLPTVLSATDSIYYDGWWFGDFDLNFNSYWGVSYTTNTFATPTVLIGSITTTANAITISNVQQIYLPLNLIIPPTHLVGGGTVTLKIYCNPTSINHYLTLTPINTARMGIAIN